MEIPQPQPLASGSGWVSKITNFLFPQDIGTAVQGMGSPMGMAALPGQISESAILPMLRKILAEKGLDVGKATSMAMDAVTSGKIAPDQFKMIYGALKRLGLPSAGAAARVFAPAAEQATEQKVASSIGPAAEAEAPLAGAARALQEKFGKGVVRNPNLTQRMALEAQDRELGLAGRRPSQQVLDRAADESFKKGYFIIGRWSRP